MAPRSYERLPTQDSSFVMFERRHTHMHVSALAIFEAGALAAGDGLLDIERIRAHVESRLHEMPRYRQRLAFTPLQGHPVWIDDASFNLRYHVRHTSLPRPGSLETLKELTGRIMSQQLDRDKPLWEMWIVEGLEGGRFAMITKVHHCMVDGIAGVSLLHHLLSDSAQQVVEPAPSFEPRRAPGTGELIVDELIRGARAPLLAMRAIAGALREPRRAAREVAESAISMWQAVGDGLRPPAGTPFNQPIGTHRRVDWRTLDLAEVRDLKKRLDGTVNDVLLTVVSGAVRRFLEQRGARLQGLDYRVVIPVNMRAAPTGETSGNRVSAWFLSLPVDESDPLRRFERIQAETRRLKRSKTAQGTELFTRIVDWTGSTLLTYAGVRLVSRMHPYNLIVTNVPGPQFPLYLQGARLLELHPQLPLFENQGLAVAIMSYLGNVCCGLIADWDLVPDLPVFAEAIPASFAELREAAERRGGELARSQASSGGDAEEESSAALRSRNSAVASSGGSGRLNR